LTAQEAAELRKHAEVQVLLPGKGSVNRRVYFLAVNQNRPALKNERLRRCLALAVDREKLLNEHFRGPLAKEGHHALNARVPAHSWACSPRLKGRGGSDSLDPFDPDKARALAQHPSVQNALGPVALELKYPEGDPQLAKAMEALRDQVKAV